MTLYELDYEKFECLPQIHQLSTTFISTIEEFFEILETVDIYVTLPHSIIETILNRDFGNKFQHQNGPNQLQHIHKNTSQQYQQRNTIKQYQPRSYQIPRTSSIKFLKEDCIVCVINNKGARELIIQNDEKL